MNIGELAKFRGGIATDTISEVTSASGVTIDSVLLKDGSAQNSGFYGAEPGAVSSSTSGQAGTAVTASRSDHNHDLGAHTHTDAASGGLIVAASATQQGAVTTGSQTFAGAKTFSGGVVTDTISEATAASGVTIDSMLIKDGKTSIANIETNTSGVAPASGVLGAMFGTERAGTGGSAYSTETTTSATTSNAELASITVDKGVYLVMITIQQQKATNTNADGLYLYGAIGGTTVIPKTSGDIFSSATVAGQYVTSSVTFPCVISTNGTKVAAYGKWAVNNGMSGKNIISAIRIG